MEHTNLVIPRETLLDILKSQSESVIIDLFESLMIKSDTSPLTKGKKDEIELAIDKIVDINTIRKTGKRLDVQKQESDFVFINCNKQAIKLQLDEICYVKGMSDYIIIKTIKKSYTIRDNLKNVEELLSASNFVRVHKSYIVPIGKIESIEGSIIKILGESIPIGRLYRNHFFEKISNNQLG